MKDLNPKTNSIEEILKAYRRYIIKISSTFTNNDYVKKELIQEAEINLYKAYINYTEGDFHPYAITYIRGAMMNYLTQKTRTVKPSTKLVLNSISNENIELKQTISIDVHNEDGYSIIETISIEEEDNELDDQQEAIRSLLRQYLSQLKEQYQIILKLRYVEEKSITEIGQELGISRQAVDQQLEKAIAKLQKAFGVEQKRNKGIRVGIDKPRK